MKGEAERSRGQEEPSIAWPSVKAARSCSRKVCSMKCAAGQPRMLHSRMPPPSTLPLTLAALPLQLAQPCTVQGVHAPLTRPWPGAQARQATEFQVGRHAAQPAGHATLRRAVEEGARAGQVRSVRSGLAATQSAV